ncbi:hypothetical protein ACFOYU_00155 [Microvirga sp. GCM10011540]|uniref:hypothetical protein n=1 Tax=Microvirga sp. GCM10011540 TaxID=3317338 RepID=UPI00361D7B89
MRVPNSAVVAADRNNSVGDILPEREKHTTCCNAGLLLKAPGGLPEGCHAPPRLIFAMVDDACVPRPIESRTRVPELFGNGMDARSMTEVRQARFFVAL